MESLVGTLPCPYNDSLLFQFILLEILHAQKEVNAMEQLLEQQQLAAEPSYSHSTQQQLFQLLKAFTGQPQNRHSLFSPGQQQGTMSKLKSYALSFQQESRQKELMTFKKLARKGWLQSVELGDILENSQGLKLFARSLAKISKTVHALQEPLTKLISQFRDDENVVYFILSRQQSFDSLFGTSFTANQLKLMFTSLQKSAQFLLHSYAQRRFDKLLPIISKKIADLGRENES